MMIYDGNNYCEIYKPLPPSKILDNLYLGNEHNSQNLQSLSELNIKYILIAGNCLHAKYPDNISEHFDEAYQFIKEGIKAGGCLVHCAAGVSRSSSLVIAFLMKDNLWNLNEAFNYVYQRRPLIYPNYGFQKQLKQFEVDLGLISKEDYENEIEKNKLFLIELNEK